MLPTTITQLPTRRHPVGGISVADRAASRIRAGYAGRMTRHPMSIRDALIARKYTSAGADTNATARAITRRPPPQAGTAASQNQRPRGS